MKKIKMKIVEWDDSTMNLVVKFSSDDLSKPIDEQTPLCYQPLTMFPNISNVDEIIKRLAVSGIHICEIEKIKEDAANNQNLKNSFKELKDKEFEFDVDFLSKLNQPSYDVEDVLLQEFEELFESTESIRTKEI